MMSVHKINYLSIFLIKIIKKIDSHIESNIMIRLVYKKYNDRNKQSTCL